MMLSLDIAVSTYKPEGILRVEKMVIDPIPGIRYVVSWQEHENAPIPDSLKHREDIEIHRLEKKGLSSNRNNSLAFCNSDLVLISDDDMQYSSSGLKTIIDCFERNPEVEVGTFKVKYGIPKIYPDQDCNLSLPFPKKYFGSSVEIAFRKEPLRNLKFNEKMGLGTSKFQSGEDELFLIEAIKKGFNCRFFNSLIGTHPGESTGDLISPGILRGQGLIIRIRYPYSSFLRIPLKAWRLWKSKKYPIYKGLLFLSEGAISKIPK